NDYQATDMVSLKRWDPKLSPQSGWSDFQPHSFVHKGDKTDTDWLRYQNLLRPRGPVAGGVKVEPQLITDVMGYNSHDLLPPEQAQRELKEQGRKFPLDARTPPKNW